MKKIKKMSKKTKIILIVVIAIFVIAIAASSAGNSTLTASKTYTVEAQPATEEILGEKEKPETKINGYYVFGKSPSEYATGEEEEFTTAQSGEYTAGKDFKPGVYDVVPVSGSGNVMGSELNIIMGTAGSNDFGTDMYTDYYDNVIYKEGNTLKVSGVSVKLVPQNDDKFIIPADTYNLEVVKGSGNVMGSGINEIMGDAGTNDFGTDMYTQNYDNYKASEGSDIKVLGVQIRFVPTESQYVVKEKSDAIPAHDVTEEIFIDSSKNETCKIDSVEKKCSELKYYDDLKKEALAKSEEK